MSLIINAPENEKYDLKHKVQFFTAAAPPPAKVLEAMQKEKFDVTHLYGLTETYGPAVVNDWHSEWNNLSLEKQAILKSRQGVRYLPLEDLKVLDPDNMEPVPHDGKTIGEVMFRGNVVMKGYFKNRKATLEAFQGGWFHSGDLGVTYPDGYIQLKDRSKDIIISGGENISSIEIEEVLYTHPSVNIAAVVAMKHKKWGETPCAFIETKSGKKLDEDEIIKWCRQSLASYKVPKKVIFKIIPRTSTGKIQKYLLRDLI
jgi:fatty-acyl-CoA synthase